MILQALRKKLTIILLGETTVTEYKPDCLAARQIEAVETFVATHHALSSSFTMENLEAGMCFDIDVSELYDNGTFLEQWPSFKEDFYENPTNTLNCIKLGIYQVYSEFYFN